MGPSCTTGADGTCTIDAATLASLRGSDTTGYASGDATAYITAAGYGPLLVPQVGTATPYRSREGGYKGVVVLDRGLVKQGDDLHVTGGWSGLLGGLGGGDRSMGVSVLLTRCTCCLH